MDVPDRNEHEHLAQALIRMEEAVRALQPLFPETRKREIESAIGQIRRKILPLLRKECPLLVSVTGGGSTGKSTLFNLLAGGTFSGVKSKAGYTRRPLAAIHPGVARDPGRMELLFELFRENARPVPLKTPNEMLTPGDPLYVESESIPERLAILDTPDFDTGCREGFANRGAAEEILAASDVLLYLFTNQTYNNKANAEFVRKAVSGIGRRKVVLIYRCSAAYPDEEVEEHMAEVLRNLFPGSSDPRAETLGLYRMDESDAVVRDGAAPVVRALGGFHPLPEALGGLDIADIRRDVLRTTLESILAAADEALRSASIARDELTAYRDAVRLQTSHAAVESLKGFPQRELLETFAREWERAQPWFVRQTQLGRRKVSKGLKSFARLFRKDPPGAMPQDRPFPELFRDDFEDQVQKLRARLRDPQALQVRIAGTDDNLEPLRAALERLDRSPDPGTGLTFIARPSVLQDALDAAFRTPSDEEARSRLTDQGVAIVTDNRAAAGEIRRMVMETRSGMSGWDKARENILATVEILPLLAGAAYVIFTMDPVGGGGTVAHLSSVFGLNHLYAGIAIPATLGIDAKRRADLEKRLAPLYARWFDTKVAPIRALFETVASPATRPCDDLLAKTGAPLERLRAALSDARTIMEPSS